MRLIKIFLASSEELQDEREAMSDLVEDLNFSLTSRGIVVQLVKWEYLNSDMGPEHKQEEYNRELRDCEMCMVIFWRRFGTYTKKELNVAYEGRCEKDRNPQRLWVYFKDGSELSDELREFRDSFVDNYGHFCGRFINIDTLKYDFLSQFIKYQDSILKDNFANIENSQIVIDGKVYVNLNNVPSFANNEEYQLLLKNIKKTQKLLAITPIDDDEYREYSDELISLQERRKQMESSLWDTALLIAELNNKNCSERLKRAIELFNNGNNKGAQEILNEDEISRDATHNLRLIRLGEEGKKGLEINIDELLFKIKTLTNSREDKWFLKVDSLYEKCLTWGRNILSDEKLYEIYAGYFELLVIQREYSKASLISVELLKTAHQLYANYSLENAIKLAAVLNDIALLEWENQHFLESEKYCEESLRILRQMPSNDSSSLRIKAITLCNLAGLYSDTNHYQESETLYKESLEIYRRLAKDKPSAYEPDWARIFESLATLYANTKRYQESETLFKESLEIYRRLAKDNPSAYEPSLARTLYNIATQYSDTNRYQESERLSKESLEIYRRLAKDNPSAYEPDLAGTLGNLATLYSDTNRYQDSETLYKESLEIYRKLVNDNPSVYEPDLAMILGNLATLYADTNRYQESETLYKESLEIYRRLAKDNPSVYAPDLARTLSNLGCVYSDTNRYQESEILCKDSLDIYRRLAKDNPSAYSSELTRTLGCLAYNTMFFKRFNEAELLSREAIVADSTQNFIYPNLASSLLFQGKIVEAEELYEKYKSIVKEMFLDDFKKFEEMGVIPKELEGEVERIKRMLCDE